MHEAIESSQESNASPDWDKGSHAHPLMRLPVGYFRSHVESCMRAICMRFLMEDVSPGVLMRS